jgi:hypothetical protein
MLRRGHGVKKAVTWADVIKLFPATACSGWQDALYTANLRFSPAKRPATHRFHYFAITYNRPSYYLFATASLRRRTSSCILRSCLPTRAFTLAHGC